MLNHGRTRYFILFVAAFCAATAIVSATHGEGDNALFMGVLAVFNTWLALNLPRE